MKVSKEARSARDIVYDIQDASACIRQDNARIDRLFEELQALVDGHKGERSLVEGYLKLEFVTEVGNSTKIETVRKFDELTIENVTVYDEDWRFSGREPEVIGSEMTLKLVWYGATPTHVELQGKGQLP